MRRYIFLVGLLFSNSLFAAAPVLDLGVDTSNISNANHSMQKQAESNTSKHVVFASFNAIKLFDHGIFTTINLHANDVDYKKKGYNDYWSWGATATIAKKFVGFDGPLIESSLRYTQRHYDDYSYPASDAYVAGVKITQRITDRLSGHVRMSYSYDERIYATYRYSQAMNQNGEGIAFELGFEQQLFVGSVYADFEVALQDEIASKKNSAGIMQAEYWRNALRYDVQIGYNLPITDAFAADLLFEYTESSNNTHKNYKASVVSLALIYRFSL